MATATLVAVAMIGGGTGDRFSSSRRSSGHIMSDRWCECSSERRRRVLGIVLLLRWATWDAPEPPVRRPKPENPDNGRRTAMYSCYQ
jgi:hypothetical protein